MKRKKTTERLLLSWSIPLIVITSYGLLSLQGDLRYSIPLLMGVTGFLVIVLSAAHYFSEKQELPWSPVFILSVAALIRCLFLFRTPELSDDIYRYIWDGLHILHGNNPYRHAPVDVLPSGEFSLDLLNRINHSELITIYPPAAQVIFMAGVFISESVFGLKALLMCLDLGTCAVIMKILSDMEMPVSRAVIYAWHPIPVLEIAASGHIDGAGVLFLLISIRYLLLASRRQRESSLAKRDILVAISGFAFGTAALVKLQPLIILPCLFLLVPRGKRLLFGLSIVASMTMLMIPFLPEMTNAFGTLNVYFSHWEFSNFFFRILRSFTQSGDTSRLILAVFLISIVSFLTGRLWKSATQPASSRLFFTCQGDGREERPIDSRKETTLFFSYSYLILFVSLLANPTLYPWYSIILICFLPFAAGPAGIIFSWSVLLSYSILIDYVYLGQWAESDLVSALIMCGPITGALLQKCMTYFNLPGKIHSLMRMYQ